ncbi:MAG: glutamate--tRNA ligase, partial [Chitinivibrionales bacterium]|nr:glutamate--tRNA ligase [Chitinivibrionales bacterium]MBD3355671.1 glutamate--tRNA ligase [Chitinivibrionales bacterium]
EIYESLKWLGLEWDEGPEVGGAYGPYVQSERTDLYRSFVENLIADGRAYRCFCTPERLAEVRARQEKEKKATIRYDRHCRCLSDAENEAFVAEGKPFVVRFKTPEERPVVFEDRIRGRIEYRSDILEDTILLKSDGFPTYHLANVVDDHHMHITHVIRGEEWIASTPLHVLMYEAFGWEPPRFAHVPVILSPEGGKLSKRKGAASVMDYKRAGYLSEALFNFLALVGWAPGDDREKMSRSEIIDAFSLDKVSPKAAVFDEKKLEWLNGQYLQERSVESVMGDVFEKWKELRLIPDDASPDDPALQDIVGLLKDRSRRVTDIASGSRYFFADPTEYEEKAAKKHFKGGAPRVLVALRERLAQAEPWDHTKLEETYRRYAEEEGLSAGKLIHPTRLAVSGVSFGPGLFELLESLGKEKVLRRIDRAVQWLRERDGEGPAEPSQ